MAFVNLTSKTWGSSPAITLTPAYEMKRDGANMLYRIKMTISSLTGSHYFGYPIYMKTTLAGTLRDTHTLKNTSPSQWSSAITYTTDWFTVSNKTTGTTALSLNVYSGSGSSRNSTYSYSLPIEPAASVLGTISSFTITSGVTIPITKYSSSFTDTLTISVGGSTVKTVSGITNGTKVTFTDSELSTIYGKLANAKSGTFTFKLTTKSGSTTIGTSSKTATGTIPVGGLGGISDFALNNSMSITISNYSSVLTYNLTIALNGTTVKTVNGVTNGSIISFTSSELTTIYSKLPNVSSSSFAFNLTTKNGTATVGISSKTVTGTIPDSVKPTISSVTISEANTDVVPSSWGVFVKGKSMLKFTINASAGSGASIYSIRTTFDGVQRSGSTVTTNLLSTYGDIPATIEVTDTRMRFVSNTRTVSIVNYNNPYITTIKAVRCDANGNENDSGSYAKVTLVGGIYSVNGKNTPTYQIKYKKSTEDTYTTYTFTNTSDTISSSVILSDIDTNNSYDIQGVITDYFTSTTKFASTLPSAFTTVDYLKGGKGAAFGKVAEEEGLLDIAFKTKLGGGIEAITLEGGTDLDDINTAGFYKAYKTNEVTYTNSPLTSGAFTLEVSVDANGRAKQILSKHRTTSDGNLTSSALFERVYYNSWGRWHATGNMHTYNSSGSSGWYKILSTSATNNYSEITGTFFIKSGAAFPETAGIIAFTYYNSGNPRFRLVSGNIPLSCLKAYKNADNTLDIYVKAKSSYMPLHIKVLSLEFNRGVNVNIDPEYIGDSISSEGEECYFYIENECGGRAETLYNNSSGATGAITLNEDVSNFSYIEIFFFINGYGYNSVKVHKPEGKTAYLSVGLYQDNYFYTNFRHVLISGTAITTVDAYRIMENSSTLTAVSDAGQLRIYRVVGYE